MEEFLIEKRNLLEIKNSKIFLLSAETENWIYFDKFKDFLGRARILKTILKKKSWSWNLKLKSEAESV